MNKLREFHIIDFPIDRIFILLKETFHKELFKFISQYGFRLFNIKIFNSKLNYHTFKQWKYRQHFIPLWFVVYFYNNFKEIFPLSLIEKNIEAYKGPSVSSIITSPVIPLIEDGRMLKILAHTLGDGYVGGAFGTKLSKGKSHSEYRNFSPHLLDQFRRDLAVFGDVPTTINYEHGHVIFPNSIGYLLGKIYKIKFDTFNSMIPEELYSLSPNVISGFLRAFVDDEGHVYDSSIEIYSANKMLLEGIIKLINSKFPSLEISRIMINYSSKNPKFSFNILNKSLLCYSESIGLDHPTKNEDLLFSIKRAAQWRNFRKTKDTPALILKSIKNGPKTAKDLSRELFVRHSYILKKLGQLEQKGLVAKTSKTLHQAWIWQKL